MNKMPCRISDGPQTPEDQEEMWRVFEEEDDRDWWFQLDEEMREEDDNSKGSA